VELDLLNASFGVEGGPVARHLVSFLNGAKHESEAQTALNTEGTDMTREDPLWQILEERFSAERPVDRSKDWGGGVYRDVEATDRGPTGKTEHGQVPMRAQFQDGVEGQLLKDATEDLYVSTFGVLDGRESANRDLRGGVGPGDQSV